MHSGNASGIHRPSALFLIKPSGFAYDKLRPEHLCVIRLDGTTAERGEIPDGAQSSLRPSVDTVHHLTIYREDPQLGGVVHTHSSFATAWAAVGRAIPCALTAMADEFGGEIPCARYASPEGEGLARTLLAARGRGPAVLAARHGLFTFDATPTLALKAAVMAEDVARTLFLAQFLGPLDTMEESEAAQWWSRYHATYGQPPEAIGGATR
jgi:L-ribulose-5-phosphate 4-epimerase